MRRRFGWKPVLLLLALAVLAAVGSSGVSAALPSCNADNSVVTIARSQPSAVAGETVTFRVSSGNPTSVDGCDIQKRVIRLTLPNGSFLDFGPFQEPNGTPVTTRGSLTYVTNTAELKNGQWTATADATGTQLDGFDSKSTWHKETAVNQLVPATTLTASANNPTKAHAGDVVTITVTETNSGQVALHNVSVTGTPCATWTPVGVFNGNLAIGASQDFTCAVTVGAPGTSTPWAATGNGLDTQNNPAPDTNEHQSGAIQAINPKTSLTVEGTPPVETPAGDPVTVTVLETNTGNDTLAGVNVTGGPCATWAAVGAFNGTLAPTQSQQFSCTFSAGAAGTDTPWFADGHGTDSLGKPAPDTDEHQQGSVHSTPRATACPAGQFTGTLVSASGDVSIKYDQFPAPNDNSYGANAVGWPNGHKFNDLVGSDHAGIQLVRPDGTVALDFKVDYISTKTGTPSGYASLGPFGGDGGVTTGTLNTDPNPAANPDISWDTSLARNLNNTGYFAGGVQVVGTSVANLLVDSPPTLDPTGASANAYTLTPAAAAVFTAPNPDSSESPGWNFHDTYFVTLKAAKLASLGFDPANFGSAFVDASGNLIGCAQAAPGKWCVQPNGDELHNSPAKPCPTTSGGVSLSVTSKKVDKKQVQIVIKNSSTTADAFLTQLALTWPQATNGNLLQIKLDGDVLYNTNLGVSSPAMLGVPPLVADQNKRKIGKNSSDTLILIFENNADPDFTHYTGTASFQGGTNLTILP